jgi:hypothetical protein
MDLAEVSPSPSTINFVKNKVRNEGPYFPTWLGNAIYLFY